MPVTHAPVLGLPDPRGKLAQIIADFRGRRVVLYFYPRDNTPGCATQSPKSMSQLRLVRSKKNYGKRIYGNYSIDRSRSTLMVGLNRFTAKSNQNLTQRRY